MELAAFHLQAATYDHIRPPAFGNQPHLKSTEIGQRARKKELTKEALEKKLDLADPNPSLRTRLKSVFGSSTELVVDGPTDGGAGADKDGRGTPTADAEGRSSRTNSDTATSLRGTVRSVKSINSTSGKSRRELDLTTDPEIVTSAFLQEAAHLLSLLSAVAMSTLRNDVEHAESPLATFHKGRPWPHVDPDSYSADVRSGWAKTSHRSYTVLRYLLGFTRGDSDRTLYNAARPFRVVGGVSDGEVEQLQTARGPLAKVALCSMWLLEFISREHLAGSTGKIAPPILSRLYQFSSDGMLG